jgi:hypothetical protein
MDIQTLWILNETAMIFWGKPGVFVNNTADMNVTMCNWTKGEGKYEEVYSSMYCTHYANGVINIVLSTNGVTHNVSIWKLHFLKGHGLRSRRVYA